MFKYLDLCVELKKSHIAKEGLFQYRNMFQLVSSKLRNSSEFDNSKSILDLGERRFIGECHPRLLEDGRGTY